MPQKKILYPVGTFVKIRDDVRSSVAMPHDMREVLDYIKGADKPYVISRSRKYGGGVSPRKFNVKELQRWREPTAVDSHRQETVQTPEKSIKAAEVREIIREELERVERDRAAQAAEARLEEEMIAEAICVAKQTNAAKAAEQESLTMNETIRQKIRYATKSKQERVLTEEGVLQNGALTEQGRRVVVDFLWDDNAELRETVYKAVLKATGRDKKAKKAQDDEE